MYLVIFVVVSAVLVAIEGVGDTCCCEKRGFPHNGYTYQIVDCPMTYAQAKNYCKNKMLDQDGNEISGVVLWIEDYDENKWIQFILNMHYGHKQFYTWIGLNWNKQVRPFRKCNYHPKYWYWYAVGRSRPTYDNWGPVYYLASRRCQHHTKTESCAILYDNYHWEDSDCDYRFKFVCKTLKRVEKPGTPSPAPFDY